jgi:hypothetical protein
MLETDKPFAHELSIFDKSPFSFSPPLSTLLERLVRVEKYVLIAKCPESPIRNHDFILSSYTKPSAPPLAGLAFCTLLLLLVLLLLAVMTRSKITRGMEFSNKELRESFHFTGLPLLLLVTVLLLLVPLISPPLRMRKCLKHGRRLQPPLSITDLCLRRSQTLMRKKNEMSLNETKKKRGFCASIEYNN